jgi:hypothetical protein
MVSLTQRHDDRIAGVLSCYDRVVVTGTLPTVCYAEGMTRFLYASGIRIFDYPAFASTLRDRVRDRAVSVAAEAGVTIEHVSKSHTRKEAIVAKVLEQRGEDPGLVHILSAMEACPAYKAWHDKPTHKTYVCPDGGKCLHYYFHFMDAVLGLNLSARSHPGAVPSAILLQRSQLAGTAADCGRHRVHRRRQRLRPHRRLATRAGAG